MAAHSACADAALADDRHWDAVAGGDGAADDDDSEPGDGASQRRSAGCLAFAIIAVLALVILLG
jgi:hypothetical protein